MSLPSGPGSDGSPGRLAPDGVSAPVSDGSIAASGTEAFHPCRHIELAMARQLPLLPWASPVTPFDSDLDHFQRDAVARALATPDFVQIQGPAGTGKSRVAFEIARQSVARGLRVVWLSQSPVALTTTISFFARTPGWTFRRVCGHQETWESLDPICREHSANYIESKMLAERTAETRRLAKVCEDRLRLLESLGSVLREVGEAAPALAATKAELDRLNSSRESLAVETDREILQAGDSGSYLVQRIRKLDQQNQKDQADRKLAFAELADRQNETQRQVELVKAELEELRPKSEAVKTGGIFSLTKWKAMLDTSLQGRHATAEKRLAELEQQFEQIGAEQAQLIESHRLADEESQSKRARFLSEEIDRLAREINQKIEELSPQFAERNTAQQDRLARLEHAGILPQDGEERLASEIDSLRQKLAEHANSEANLGAECAAAAKAWEKSVPVAIGPADAVEILAEEQFDLLILDDAHLLSDAELNAVCALAPRRVFVGESPERHHRHAVSRPEWWGRLWHALHHPRTWVEEGEHLVCRLHPLTAAERRKCDREPVVDNPAIELRLAAFLEEPVLAEVAFPANFQATAAREFLYRELDELTVQPATHSPVWESSAERITCRFASAETDATLAVAQHPGGVTEEVRDLDTLAIHFSVAAGWTQASAAEWLDERGLKRSPGRAINLQRSQRACSGLARWLNDAFRVGYYVSQRADGEPHVEFLAVPDLRGRREPAPNRSGRSGGAGYEIALHEPKQRSLLADELSKMLPERGYVNLAEAQAIVQFVENHPSASLRISSPFPAQAMVLKHLISKSRAPQTRVIDPSEALSCECDWLLISLTRSHVSRAVTFGESPAILRRLVGCARRKILFAGDPGTLSRRLQWEGPVDHLDATDAAQERNWVAALADCPRVSANRHRPSPTSA